MSFHNASEINVTQSLSQNAQSAVNIAGVDRADSAQLASNSPCEDRLNHTRLLPWSGRGQDLAALSVFDGHNGCYTAEFLEKELLAFVQVKLQQLQSPAHATAAMIQHAMKSAFVDLDAFIIERYQQIANDKEIKLKDKMQHMQIAMSGSCALLSLFDPMTNNLYTACVGDSRGVFGQQNGDGTWEAMALSKDQKGDNEDEISRIEHEHPGESIIKDTRILDMAVSRAFGDASWKLPYNVQLELGKRFFTNGPLDEDVIPTPPYLTAEPVITVKKVDGPSFLVIATDGLWDQCENHEVVDLVVRWLEAQPDTGPLKLTPETVWWKAEIQDPVKYAPGFDFLERWSGFDPRFWPAKTVIEVEDLDNVAVHLLRNACGGNHRELLEAKLTVHAPHSRNLRDDITIQVSADHFLPEPLFCFYNDKNADNSTPSIGGHTPLHLAASSGHEAVVRLLLDQDAHIYAADGRKKTPLHCMARNGHLVVVRMLIDNNADISALTKDKWTPLHYATSKGHRAVIQLLVEDGFNTTAAIIML